MQKNILISIILFTYFNQSYSGFEFSGTDSCIEFEGDESALIFEDEASFSGGTIKFSGNSISEKIFSKNNKPIYFDKCLLRKDNEKTFISASIQDNSLEEMAERKSNKTSRALTGLNITLNSNSLSYGDVTVSDKISVKGKNNSITGRPIFSEKITLTNEATSLDIGIQSKLSQNIVLNGGQLRLTGDLVIKDGVGFEGSGVIDINNYRLCLPVKGSFFNQQISFKNANDIQLNGYTTISGDWNFSNSLLGGNSSTINGYGNVLELLPGGSITVGDGHTLFISGVNLKGLGSLAGSLNLSPTATVKFTASIIELAGIYSLNAGKISIISPNCKLVVKDSNKFMITSTGILEVDGVLFEYEALGTAPIYPPPFLPYAGGSISLINSGKLQSTNLDLFKGEFQLSLSTAQGINYITGGVNMTSQTVVRFVNENIAARKSMILDMTGKTISYSIADAGSIVADENIDLIMQNGCLDNLDYSMLLLKGSGATKSTFAFGDGIFNILRRDMTLDVIESNYIGNASVDGNNNVVTINAANMVTLSGNKTLTIKNLTIKLNDPDGIKCLSDDATIILQNVSIILGQGGMNWAKGNLKIKDYCDISSNKASNQSCLINFTSKGNLIIDDNSYFKILKNLVFKYNPTALQGETTSSQKQRINMQNRSSYFELTDCTIDATNIGITLGGGNLVIEKNVKILLSNNLGKELELKTNLNLAVGFNSSIEVNGPVKYVGA